MVLKAFDESGNVILYKGGAKSTPGKHSHPCLTFTGQGHDRAGNKVERKIMEAIALSNGWYPTKSVLNRTCLVVVDDVTTAKARKAKLYGIPMMASACFLDIFLDDQEAS